MSRGQDRRQETQDKVRVLTSIKGHDNSVAHRFNHTEGHCPKCGCGEHLMAFCNPDIGNQPSVRGCELQGEHVHRICRACKYPWIERCLDQAMLAESEGVLCVESEMAAALVVILEQAGGAILDHALVGSRRSHRILFHRDPEKRTLTLTVLEPEEQKGEIAHLRPSDVMEQQ